MKVQGSCHCGNVRYEAEVETADSGAKRAQVFCANCGSPLYTHGVGNTETYGLRVGCIESASAIEPASTTQTLPGTLIPC
ncbi:GFA family protein [Piscinibacter terrae]|uniref:CENP-V/GFA domain-containing protein n=1 Tax=Piscinibacter terrae TaxID=2496871 RepID=A0A3N7J0A6_9BURK|nr:GFA family protein [Albitalea terrae]RQP24382.1 hypothetical protein DZC73_13885 [Albitalea terrae]